MSTIETIGSHQASMHQGSAGRRSIAEIALAAIEWLETISARRRSRLALLEMNDDQLKDIGISRAEAHGEAARPFWN